MQLPASAVEQRRAIAELALAEFRKAAEHEDRSTEVFQDLGDCFERLGKADAAIEVYGQGLKLAPNSATLRNLRGWAYALRLDDYEQALADFAEALRTAPDSAEAHTGIGFVQARLKKTDEARTSAAEAMLHRDGDYLVLHHVACIYAELSQCEADREREYQDLALIQLRRAVRLWKAGGCGQPNELELIQIEESFPQSLRRQPEFQQLFE